MKGGYFISALLALSPATAQETVLWGEFGNWEVLVDPTQGNGCFAYVSYDDDSFFRAGHDMRDATSHIIFSDPDWRSLVPGTSYAIRMNFDPAGSYWDADAAAEQFDDGTLYLRFGSSEVALLDDVMKAGTAWVEYNGREIARFDLTGSGQALAGVVDCQDEADQHVGDVADPFGGDAPVKSTDPFAN